MKKALAAAGLGAALIAGPLAGAGMAHAGNGSFTFTSVPKLELQGQPFGPQPNEAS